MRLARRPRSWAAAVVVTIAAASMPSLAAPAMAQAPPDLSAGSPAPAGARDARGDGRPAPRGGITIPPGAQAIIDAVHRTPPSHDDDLLRRLEGLEALGLSRSETYRIGLGRFPIAGAARYSDDWLYPRYGPGFRFHLGCDVFAEYGTPVRAVVDGVAESSTGALGGLTVKVLMPDGTYFYYAHLSGLAPGFSNGMRVRTGDVLGYVGDSGNARGGPPHLHFGVYPQGGDPVDPKPILDGFLSEATARVPELVTAYRRAHPAAAPPARPPGPSLDGLSPEAVYVASASPLEGPGVLLDVALADLVASVDWVSRGSS